MARTKNATPLRREPSSEYTSGTPSRNRNLGTGVGVNGDLSEKVEKFLDTVVPVVKKDAGALQFLIAVGGIYGSLYVYSSSYPGLVTNRRTV